MKHANLLRYTPLSSKWGFTLGKSILQIMPKMPLSIKPDQIKHFRICHQKCFKQLKKEVWLNEDFPRFFDSANHQSFMSFKKNLSVHYFCMTVSWPNSYLLQLLPINIPILFTDFSSLLEIFKCFQRWSQITFCSEWGKLSECLLYIYTWCFSLSSFLFQKRLGVTPFEG